MISSFSTNFFLRLDHFFFQIHPAEQVRDVFFLDRGPFYITFLTDFRFSDSPFFSY